MCIYHEFCHCAVVVGVVIVVTAATACCYAGQKN